MQSNVQTLGYYTCGHPLFKSDDVYYNFGPHSETSGQTLSNPQLQCCLTAADDIRLKKIKHGYCLVHQDIKSCEFNNVTYTATYLLHKYPTTYKNILIVNIGISHGIEEFVQARYHEWLFTKKCYETELDMNSPPYSGNDLKEVQDYVNNPYFGVHFINCPIEQNFEEFQKKNIIPDLILVSAKFDTPEYDLSKPYAFIISLFPNCSTLWIHET